MTNSESTTPHVTKGDNSGFVKGLGLTSARRDAGHPHQLPALEDLRAQRRESGGQRIKELKTSAREYEITRDARFRKRAVVQIGYDAIG